MEIKIVVNKIMLVIILSMVLLNTGSLSAAEDGAPALINCQGYLTDNAGKALNGSQKITFLLYDKSEDGEPLWSELKYLNNYKFSRF